MSEFNRITQNDIRGLLHAPDEQFNTSEFIAGWFPRSHISLIAAKSGAGKTWYLLQLCADLSNGGTICSSQSYFEKPRKCLFFVGETNIDLVHERLSLMKSKANPENLTIVSYNEALKKGITLDLDTRTGAGNINDIIRQVRPDLVVFDTLMTFRRDDENTALNTRLMMGRLQLIASNNNIAVLCSHHLRKSNNKEIVQEITQDELIGSSVLVRLAAVAFVLSKKGNLTCVYTVKSWWKNPPTLEYILVDDEDEGVYFKVPDCAEDLTDKRLRVERYVANEFANGAQLTSFMVMKRCNVGRDMAINALKKFGQKTEFKLPRDGIANNISDFIYISR